MGSARKTSENAFFFGGYYVRLTNLQDCPLALLLILPIVLHVVLHESSFQLLD